MLTKLLTNPSKTQCSSIGKRLQKRLSTVHEAESLFSKKSLMLNLRRTLILLVPEVGIEPT
jgi:hypothetical protein